MKRARRETAKYEPEEKRTKMVRNEEFRETAEGSETGVQSQYSVDRSGYVAQIGQATQTEAYDPRPDQLEVLGIRKEYSHLLEEVQRNKRELVNVESGKLAELVDEANFVFSRVHTTSDASLDSRFLAASADLGAEKVHRLPLFVSEFSLSAYLGLIKGYLVNHTWEDLGRLTGKYWVGVETCDFMFGPLELQAKERAPRQVQRRPREPTGPVVRPSVIRLDEADAEAASSGLTKETSHNVMRVYEVLSGIGSFPFYHFITDPSSFAKTVENLFYVSFLINDHRARIFYPAISSEEIFIEAVIPDEENAEGMSQRLTSEPRQLVLGMTEKLWKEKIKRYSISKPFLNF